MSKPRYLVTLPDGIDGYVSAPLLTSHLACEGSEPVLSVLDVDIKDMGRYQLNLHVSANNDSSYFQWTSIGRNINYGGPFREIITNANVQAALLGIMLLDGGAYIDIENALVIDLEWLPTELGGINGKNKDNLGEIEFKRCLKSLEQHGINSFWWCDLDGTPCRRVTNYDNVRFTSYYRRKIKPALDGVLNMLSDQRRREISENA